MSRQSNVSILGITGAFGSGKSTAAQFFETNGFTRITLSSFLEKEAIRRQLPLTRQVLQDLGNELREKKGKGILAQLALSEIEEQGLQKIVIDGIRNVGEIEVLRNSSEFVLLGIVSDRKNRFKRLQDIKRREVLTWELFEKLDYRDLGIASGENGLQVASCIALSDHFIENNTTKEYLIERLHTFL